MCYRFEILNNELQSTLEIRDISNSREMSQIRDFLLKIWYKLAFSGLIVAKVVCMGNFQALLVAFDLYSFLQYLELI